MITSNAAIVSSYSGCSIKRSHRTKAEVAAIREAIYETLVADNPMNIVKAAEASGARAAARLGSWLVVTTFLSTQLERRRAEGLWGTRPNDEPTMQSADVPPPIVASNYRPVAKNTVIGSFDPTVTKWRFTLRDCFWQRKREREWNLPTKEWTDQDGNRKFADFGKFVVHGEARRFQELALAAVRRIAGDK